MNLNWLAPRGRMHCVAYELGTLCLVCGVALALLCVGSGFEVIDPDGLRARATLIAILPAVLLHVLLRCLWGRTFSAVIALSAVWLLTIAHTKKMALTGAPLSWNDAATVKNLRIASSYFSSRDWVVVGIVVAALCGMLAHLFFARTRPTARSLLLKGTLAIPLAAICFYPYFGNARFDSVMAQAGVSYMSWNWPGNIKSNGLLMHLVQTSVRPTPPDPTDAELLEWAAIPPAPLPGKSPQHVFYILCESCWNDSANFADVFKPLEAQGLRSMRAVSPAYGGGTVNVTFEMLTALPAQGPLIGVVFQEYGRIFSDHAMTVPSSLREEGYRTFALHNFYGDFWQRNVVMPKLGFERFISLEQMNYEGHEKFPRDSLLFDHAISLLRDHRDEKAFFNLETVHMHGPYEADGDLGEHKYEERLKQTVSDMATFVQQVSEISPDALIVIYGDHKPALNRFFLKTGVIKPREFSQTGPTDESFAFSAQVDMKKLGDVPVLIGLVGKHTPTEDPLRDFRRYATNKPFYCIGAAISYFLLPTQDPASRFVVPHVCRSYAQDTYYGNRARVPVWLYSTSLFDVDTQLDQHLSVTM